MRIGTNGILVNEFGHVLLIQRDDSRTFAPPGGALDGGELPTDGMVREVREETGLIVMPVRLVGVYFWPHKPEGFLSFVFRCLQRGGELQTSEESLQVGFYRPDSVAGQMAGAHFERVMAGLHHAGGPPEWGVHPLTWQTRLGRFLLNNVVYVWKDVRRRLAGRPPYQPPPAWQTAVSVVIRNAQGEVLWLKNGDDWMLPGGTEQHMQPPWETAVSHTHRLTGLQIQLTNLAGVYIQKENNHMTFVFTAETDTALKTAEFAHFAPGQEPITIPTHFREQVTDACCQGVETVFKFQTTP